MLRESFYSSGTYANENLGVWVGWTCHEKTFSDCLPIWNEARNVCLLFVGEVFSDGATLANLRNAGHSIEGTNASYLVHLYEDRGLEFVRGLNGWFCGVVIDLRKRSVALFTDRYGLGRVYYHEDAGGFYFGSEAKSLLRVLPRLRELDTKGLGEVLTCGCTMRGRSLYSGVSVLPPAALVTFDPAVGIKRGTYFAASEWENQEPLSGEAFYAKLLELYPRVLQRYFREGERSAMSLTGGLDGRMVMAWSKQGPGCFPCYTFNGPYRICEDARLARLIANACKQEHRLISVGDECLGRFPELARKTILCGDGAMNVTGAIELYTNELCRHVAPIRMTGNYGSEILRHSVAFKPWLGAQEFVIGDLLPTILEAQAVYQEESAGRRLSFIVSKQVPCHHFNRFVVEQSQLSVRGPFLDNDLVNLAFRAPASALDSREVSLKLIAAGNPLLGRIPTDRGITWPANPYVNRVRYFWKDTMARAEYACDYGLPNWLAPVDRCLTATHIEKIFLGKQKFCHFRIWYRKQLASYVGDMLLDPRALSRPYLDKVRTRRLVEAHLAGKGNYTLHLHMLLTLELIHQLLLEAG
jgi:asparagine synthase (glutamine-hydrolysing)